MQDRGSPMRVFSAILVAAGFILGGCTTTRQFASPEFTPPGNYRLVVMRPDISVGVLTAGGAFEPRESWTDQARDHVLAAIQDYHNSRGGSTSIVSTLEEGSALLVDLNRMHQAVGSAILLHKYTDGQALPTKKDRFDWTLGEDAIRYGETAGQDYALFLYARDSFSSGGRVALQAVGLLGCAFGACFLPVGGSQLAFASLVDLKSGYVVWFNFLRSDLGDIRERPGADRLVAGLLKNMQPSDAARAGRR